MKGPKKTQKKQKRGPKPQTSSFKNLSLDYGNESYTPDDAVSQVSNTTDQFVPVPLINLESNPLFKYHRQNITLRHKIIRTFGFCFYTLEEYALLNYICYVIEGKFRNQIGFNIVNSDLYKEHQYKVEIDVERLYVKKDELNAKFFDAEKNLQALKQSRMLMDKEEDAGGIKINSKFFSILPAICDDMLKKTGEQEKQLGGSQQVRCKGCGKKREMYQIQAKNRCECGSNQGTIKDQKHNHHKINSMLTLNDQISRVMKWKNQMDQLRSRQIQRITQLRSKNSEGNRVTDADKDVAKAIEYIEKEYANITGFVSPWQKFPIKKNGVNMRMAEKQFQPKRTYNKVRELKEVAETRKKRKIQKPQIPDTL